MARAPGAMEASSSGYGDAGGRVHIMPRNTFLDVVPEPGEIPGVSRSQSWSSGDSRSSGLLSGQAEWSFSITDSSSNNSIVRDAQEERRQTAFEAPRPSRPRAEEPSTLRRGRLCPHCGASHSETGRPSASRRNFLKEMMSEIRAMPNGTDRESHIADFLNIGGVFACKLIKTWSHEIGRKMPRPPQQNKPESRAGFELSQRKVKSSPELQETDKDVLRQVLSGEICAYCLRKHREDWRPSVDERGILTQKAEDALSLSHLERTAALRSLLRGEGGSYICDFLKSELDDAELAKLSFTYAGQLSYGTRQNSGNASSSSTRSPMVPLPPGAIEIPSGKAHSKLSL
eukprot:TRINITY_DN42871_c0_g1_i1.p1 TRINITY_DN42871_c0_g1~~TRINITY_DN42871_c0_g1_i1.p1  ORF type:complete len:344 (-),score=45.31 TRINITY_DN42871_c0_g1_i1:8-1039(-)